MADDLNNIKPTQPGLFNVESTSAHTDLNNGYFDADKAFQGLEASESSSAHTSLFTSSYQYILTPATGTPDTFLTEYISGTDSILEFTPAGTDRGVLLFDIVVEPNVFLTEYISGTDSLALSAEREAVEVLGTMVVQIREQNLVDGTVISRIRDQGIHDGTIDMSVLDPNLAAVTSATSASNVFLPTSGSGGTIYYSNPETLPSNIPDDACWTKYDKNIIEVAGEFYPYGQVYNWTLDLTNKSFNIDATTQVATYDQDLEIFGFPAVSKTKGRQIRQGTNNVSTKGVLGTQALNQQLLFGLGSSALLSDLIPNQYLVIPNPNKWTTYKGASLGIAAEAGISLQWTIPDLPLQNLQDFNNQKIIEALENLAEGAGGKLRHLGGTNYVVKYPNDPTGTFTLPDCCFVESIQEECNVDVIRNLFGPGTSIRPTLPQIDPTTLNQNVNQEVQGNGGPPKQVTRFWSTSKVLTQDDPVIKVDVPSDFESVFIRTLTKSDGNGLYVVTEDSVNNLFGSDAPQDMFLLQTGFSGRYINWNDVNGELKPQINVDFSLFPEGNAEVDSGNFITELFVQPKSLQDAFDQQAQEEESQQRTDIGKTQARYKFAPVCVIDATFFFTGAIPLEGMLFSLQYGDELFEGIIENVVVNKVGRSVKVSIVAVQYQELDLLQRLSTFRLQIDPDNPEELLP